jgi:hypothetical protein
MKPLARLIAECGFENRLKEATTSSVIDPKSEIRNPAARV